MATQMPHLRNGKRDAGREKIEAQAKDNISHLLPGEKPLGGQYPAGGVQAESQPLAAAHVHAASRRLNQCATQGDAS